MDRHFEIKHVLWSVLILLAVVSQLSYSQDFQISKKVLKFNDEAYAAVNPLTGNIFVVWWQREVGNPTFSKVWYVFGKRKSSGKIRFKKPKLVGSKQGYNARPFVAWIPGSEEFLIVWDTFRGFSSGKSSDILAQAFSAKKGKPSGGIKTVISNSNQNYAPKIIANVIDGSLKIWLLYSNNRKPAGIAPTEFAKVGSLEGIEVLETYEVSARSWESFSCPEPNSFSGFCEPTTVRAFRSISRTEPETFTNCFIRSVRHFDDGVFTYGIQLVHDGEVVDEIIFPDGANLNYFGELGFIPGENRWGGNYELNGERILFKIVNSGCDSLNMEIMSVQKMIGGVNRGKEIHNKAMGGPVAQPINTNGTNDSNTFTPAKKGSSFNSVVALNDGFAYQQVLLVKKKNKLKEKKFEKLFTHDDRIRYLNAYYIWLQNQDGSFKLPDKGSNAFAIWIKSIGIGNDREVHVQLFEKN